MTSSIEIPSIDLRGEVSIPQFGLGVFQVPPEETTENVLHAIEAGYHHIDAAKAYGNEAQVGQAVRASGLDRSEFSITTKCFNDDHATTPRLARSRRASGSSRWSTSICT